MAPRLIGFADGENLVHRFQEMVASGAKTTPGVIHLKDLAVWHPEITECFLSEVIRIVFYQTCFGDEQKLLLSKQQVKAITYTFSVTLDSHGIGSGSLVPRIFKKEKKSTKTKSVDINLTVDMLRFASNPQIDALLLLSGDGDYLPLVEEVARQGKQVWVAAFSSGLHSEMKLIADEFVDLDKIFFQ